MSDPPTSPANAGPAAEPARVEAELIALLFRLSRGTRYIPIVALSLLVALHWQSAPRLLLVVAFAAYLAATAGFDWLRRAYAWAKPDPIEAPIWARRFAVCSFLSGTVWGALGYRLAMVDDVALYSFTTIVLVLMVTSSVVARSSYLPAFYAFVAPTTALFVLGQLMLGRYVSLAVAGGAVAYVAALAMWAHNLNRSHRDIVALRFENSALIERLSQAREAAERGRDAAESGNRAKTQFLATVGHELRTPLNGILGMADLLLNSRLDAEQRSYAEVVRDGGRKLLRIINDILDFTQLEADRIELEIAPFDVNALVKQAIARMAPRAAEKGLSLSSYVDADVPASMLGDRTRILRVLSILLDNAVKFTDSGSVSCEVSRMDDGTTVFQVVDTGPGVPASVQPHVFERFTSGDTSFARRHGGSGLGLAIAHRLVEAMGGTIGVDGAAGGGSRFWFRLKLRAGPADAMPAAAPAEGVAPRRRALRLLVADDVDVNRRLTQRMLERGGHRVDVAADGAAAIEAASHTAYDLILMDVEMPGLHGLDAAEAIRRLPGAAGRVRIVALTAHSEDLLMARCRAAGMNDFLTKPIDAARLDAILAAL
ncbi:MAG TPA: ATP-binding protein [Candidatus Cybelea sp.]|nr:ATP-binding protein [Candidatus Cybelea sp.]